MSTKHDDPPSATGGPSGAATRRYGSSSSTSLTNRYRAPKPGLPGRVRLLIIAAVLALAVAGTAIFSFTSGNPAVSSKDVGFNILDSTHATVDFQVTKSPDATVQCAVQILSEDFAIVGWKVETIGPNLPSEGADGGRTTSHRSQLLTESMGTSGGVNSCWVTGK